MATDFNLADSGTTEVEESNLSLWLEDDRVVAAAWYNAEGYVWCQSWPAPHLASQARQAAKQWNLETAEEVARALADTAMRNVHLLRLVMPLAGDRTRHDCSTTVLGRTDVASRDLPLRLVASGLPSSGEITVLEWPSMTTMSLHTDRDQEMSTRVGRHRHPRQPPRRIPRLPIAKEPLMPASDSTENPIPSEADRRLALAREHLGEVLGREDFISAVLDAARSPYLNGWAGQLIEAVGEVAQRAGAKHGWVLAHFLQGAVSLAGVSISPFDGLLEAPPAITDVYHSHATSLQNLHYERDKTMAAILQDLAGRMMDELRSPVSWSDLIVLGATPVRPQPPADDHW